MHDHGNELQVQTRLAYLNSQIEQMQWELARLSREAQVSNASITAVRKYLLNSDAQLQIHKTSADLLTQLDAQQDDIEGLGKTIKKLSRTQFKANTLSESKDQQLAETLNFLKELVNKREGITTEQQQRDHERLMEVQTQARGEVAADFLPILDGIEMALEHRIEFPVMPPEPEEPPAPVVVPEEPEPSPGFLRKIFHHESKQPAPESPPESPLAASPAKPKRSRSNQTLQEWHAAMAGWLKGLEIVRDRFLTLLEYEGIERIPDVGNSFDPHRHVAVDTEERTDMEDGTIVAVIRKGYMQHERILRYAEVIVAKAPKIEEPAPPGAKPALPASEHRADTDESGYTHYIEDEFDDDEFHEDNDQEFATFTDDTDDNEYFEDEEKEEEL